MIICLTSWIFWKSKVTDDFLQYLFNQGNLANSTFQGRNRTSVHFLRGIWIILAYLFDILFYKLDILKKQGHWWLSAISVLLIQSYLNFSRPQQDIRYVYSWIYSFRTLDVIILSLYIKTSEKHFLRGNWIISANLFSDLSYKLDILKQQQHWQLSVVSVYQFNRGNLANSTFQGHNRTLDVIILSLCIKTSEEHFLRGNWIISAYQFDDLSYKLDILKKQGHWRLSAISVRSRQLG